MIRLLARLKKAWIFPPPAYEDQLLKYVVFHLHEDEENESALKRKLLLSTFLLLPAVGLLSAAAKKIPLPQAGLLVDASLHSDLEIFCGIISILIGLILTWEYVSSGKRNSLFLFLAFMSMGILDIFHAFSDYSLISFVWFHSTSVFFGGIFMFAAVFSNNKEHPGTPGWIRRFYVLSSIFVIFAFAIVSMKVNSFLPGVLAVHLQQYVPAHEVTGHFTDSIYALNFISSMLYLAAGTVLIRGFIKTNDTIYLIFGTSAVLFFESAFLFTTSTLWDPIWWYWHFIKVIVFFGLLLGLAYGFTRTVYRLHSSKLKLAGLLAEIEAKNSELIRAYENLKETQRHLTESEKLASMGRMAAMLAHEIRNPLGAITTSLGVLRNYDSPDYDDMELFGIVDQELERLNKLVEDFMTFSKSPETTRKKTDLNPLVDEVLSLLNLNTEKGREIRTEKFLNPEIPALFLDGDRIKQVLLNVLINAVQAMPNGGTLSVETGFGNTSKEVQLAIRDSGCGMSDDVLSQIFQPFFTTKDKGLGLGLSIVQKIVKEHDGYVMIESEEGVGTKMSINFPISLEDLPVEHSAKSMTYYGNTPRGG